MPVPGDRGSVTEPTRAAPSWPREVLRRVSAAIHGKDVVEVGPVTIASELRARTRSYRWLTSEPATLQRLVRTGAVSGDELDADVVLCSDLLQRCWNDRAAATTLSRLVRPGGSLLAATARRAAHSYPQDLTNMREYDRHRLTACLSEVFYEVRCELVSEGAELDVLFCACAKPKTGLKAAPFDPSSFWRDRLAAAPSLAGTGTGGGPLAWQRWLYRGKVRAYRRLLRDAGFSIPGANVIDFGCGIGFFEDYWEAAGAVRADGIDIVPDVVRNLQRRYPRRRYVHADLGTPQEPMLDALEPAALVTAIDVLFHIVDDARLERTMTRLLRLVRKGGVFLFTDALREMRSPPPHVRFRPLNLWRALLGDNGFSIVAMEPVYVLGNHIFFGVRNLPALTGFAQYFGDAIALRAVPCLANNWAVLCARGERS